MSVSNPLTSNPTADVESPCKNAPIVTTVDLFVMSVNPFVEPSAFSQLRSLGSLDSNPALVGASNTSVVAPDTTGSPTL